MGPSGARRRTLLPALAAVLLAAVAAFAWIARAPGTTGLAPERGPATVRAPAAGERVSLAAVEPEPRSTPEVSGERGLDRTAPAAAAEPASGTVEVLVRERATRAPLPHCEVLYVDTEGEALREIESMVDHRGLDVEALRHVAGRALSDEHGIARLACRTEDVYVLALGDELLGFGQIDGGPDAARPQLVECEPCSRVRAQVVDASGRPRGGVTVCVSDDSSGSGVAICSRTRGAEGIADLGPIPLDVDHGLFAWPEGVFEQDVAVPFDPRSPPAEPLRIRLPEHGSLEVRLRYDDGRPFAGAAEITLAAAEGQAPLVSAWSAQVSTRDGTARFDRVALQLDLSLKAEVRGLHAALVQPVRGPRVPGENGVVTVELPRGSLSLTGRAVDPTGMPLRFRELSVQCLLQQEESPRILESEVRTDAVGDFGVTFDAGAADAPRASVLIVAAEEKLCLGTLATCALRAGANPLGTCALRPPPALAAGTLLDADGTPCRGGSIELRELPLELQWAEPCESGAAGEFELRGWSTRPRLELQAGRPEGNPRFPFEVEQGARDCVLAFH